MRESTVTAAAVAMAVVCPAYADTRISVGSDPTPEDTAMRERFEPDEELVLGPSLVVGAPSDRSGRPAKLDRLKVAVHGQRATLTLALSTKELTGRELTTTLDVPTGARVTALAVTIGGQRSDSELLPAKAARESYEDIVIRKNDPALLEHTESTRRHDRMTLRVFPVAKTTPATVEVQLELPDVATLDIDPSSQTIGVVELDVDGATQKLARLSAPHTLELASEPGDDSEPRRPHVTQYASLFAAASTTAAPVVVTCGAPIHTVSVDKKTIRDFVKLRLPRLRHCFMQQAQRIPGLAGSADLHFTIGTDGRASDVVVDGTLPSRTVMECIAEEARTWAFHANDTPTRVNYPMSFAAN